MTMTEPRAPGQRSNLIQIGGTAWQAAIHLAQWWFADIRERREPEWETTDGLAADLGVEIDALPAALKVLVEAGVIERRWTPAAKGRGRRIEWRWVP